MNVGSKYHPLFAHLRQLHANEITLSFDEIEALLGKPLPKSARNSRSWWSNRGQGAVQATAWMGAGYHAYEVDIEAGTVHFRKPDAIYNIDWDGDTVMWDAALIRTLRHHMGTSQTELAEQMGVRQQTISEWETGMYRPKRAMSKYLMIMAERAGFTYGEKPNDSADNSDA